MPELLKRERTATPRFIDALSAAVITLWAIATVCLLITVPFSDWMNILFALWISLLLLIFGGIVAFISSGIVSFPIWFLFKTLRILNRKSAALIGGLTGAIIVTAASVIEPLDYSGTIREFANLPFLIIAAAMLLGAVAGWNGYRIAYNGRP